MAMTELQELLLDLRSPAIGLELGGLVLCGLLAWLVTWALHRGVVTTRRSILFGERLIDGLLLPALLWLLANVLKFILQPLQHVPVLKVVLPILTSLLVIRLIARVLTFVFPMAPSVRVIERGISWLAWVIAVLWVTGWGVPILNELEAIHITVGKSQITLWYVIDVVLTASTVLIFTLWLSATIEQRLLARAMADLSMRKVASNSLRAIMLLLGLLFALSALGVDLTALSVLGGAVGVGVGFGLQKLASNYVSGFVILIERSLRIGDYVRLDGFEGRVADIKTRYTLLRANNGTEAVVPNEVLITQRVENMSLGNKNLMLSSFFFVVLDSDVALVQQVMMQAMLSVARVLKDPAPSALLLEVQPQGLRWSLNYWIEDPTKFQSAVRSEVNLACLNALRSAGIRLVKLPEAT